MDSIEEKGVVRTFLEYSMPCIVGMFLTSFIIIVDGMFIGWKVGESGLAAVNLTLPVLYVLLAATILPGVGGVTMAARCLGAKDSAQASRWFSFALAVILAVNAVLIAGVAIFLDPLVPLLGARGVVAEQVKEFLGVLIWFYLFIQMNMAFSMFIRAEGKPQLSLVFGIAGNLVNIVLDYWFIVHLEWGMRGAALASGIAVLLPFLFGVAYFLSGRSALRLVRFRPDKEGIGVLLMNGLAEFIAQISVSVTTLLFNWALLARLGVSGVAAFTVIGYVLFIHNMIITGIAVGIHPLISYHFGAKNRAVTSALLATGLKAAGLIGLVLLVVSLAAAEPVIGLFARENAKLVAIGAEGLRWMSASFILIGVNILVTAYLTSVGEAKGAALVSVLRSLVLVAVFLGLLPLVFGVRGIWLALPVSEAATFAVAWLLLGRAERGVVSMADGL